MSDYRYPSEVPILTLTLIVLGAVMLFGAGLTVCLVPLVFGVVAIFAYAMNQAHNRALIEQATAVTPHNAPQLAAIVQDCVNRVRPSAVQVFVVREKQLNAYTFGLSSPHSIVLYSPLLKIMDEDELRFIIGHEMGHVALGHTWINSLLGGMAGVPTSLGAAVILIFAFRWWNRACEYSADRSGLLACRDPQKAVSAMLKLVAGPRNLEQTMQTVDAQDDTLSGVLAESISTHPMLIRRINELRKWAETREYQALRDRQAV